MRSWGEPGAAERGGAAVAAVPPQARRAGRPAKCQACSLPCLSSLRTYPALRTGSAVDMRQLTASLLEAREGTGEVRACLLRAAFKPRLPGKSAGMGLNEPVFLCASMAKLFKAISNVDLHCRACRWCGCLLAFLPCRCLPTACA